MNNISHSLKIRGEYFENILNGNKTAEFRKCDGRNFKHHDIIYLKELRATTSACQADEIYTGRQIIVRITDVAIVNSIYEELNFLPDFVMLSFEVITAIDEKRGLVLI